jgi:lipopolysaccharide assembly LptE-like protein
MLKPALLVILFASLLDVCGYKQAGKGKSLPANVKSIAVPIFQNSSLKYRVEQRFTRAVMEEILKRARGLRVTTNPDDADVVLTGDIRGFRAQGTLLDDQGRTRVWEVRIIVGAMLRDNRSHRILFQNQRISFSGQYELSDDPQSFFNEENPAVERIAKEFAQSVVSTIMEGL